MKFDYDDLENVNKLLANGMSIAELSIHLGYCDRGELSYRLRELGIKRIYQFIIPNDTEFIKKRALKEKEKQKKRHQTYYQKHREEILEKRRLYYKKNKGV